MLARTRLRYFIHPTLVKWSNLYLGIPPLIKISKAIRSKNFNAVTSAFKVVLLIAPNKEEYKNMRVKYKQSTKYWNL